MGVAIAWFATNGYTVSIPLTDSQPYDLVVDNGGGLQRVAVRTTTQDNSRGGFDVGLRTQGGNKSQFTIHHFDPTVVELLFVACGDGSQYLIPSSQIASKSYISVGHKYQNFRLIPVVT